MDKPVPVKVNGPMNFPGILRYKWFIKSWPEKQSVNQEKKSPLDFTVLPFQMSTEGKENEKIDNYLDFARKLK